MGLGIEKCKGLSESKKMIKFKPYSKYPVCTKDISFWVPPTGFHENELFELVRARAGNFLCETKSKKCSR